MFGIINSYMDKMTKDDVNNFAIKKNVFLSPEELDFTYLFIKKNGKSLIQNPSLFNIDRYKDKYSAENFTKIKKVYQEYFQKYSQFL